MLARSQTEDTGRKIQKIGPKQEGQEDSSGWNEPQINPAGIQRRKTTSPLSGRVSLPHWEGSHPFSECALILASAWGTVRPSAREPHDRDLRDPEGLFLFGPGVITGAVGCLAQGPSLQHDSPLGFLSYFSQFQFLRWPFDLWPSSSVAEGDTARRCKEMLCEKKLLFTPLNQHEARKCSVIFMASLWVKYVLNISQREVME